MSRKETGMRFIGNIRDRALSRVCRKTYAERSVGDRHAVPGAHADTQQMSTGRAVSEAVTVCPGGVLRAPSFAVLRTGFFATLRMTVYRTIRMTGALRMTVREVIEMGKKNKGCGGK